VVAKVEAIIADPDFANGHVSVVRVAAALASAAPDTATPGEADATRLHTELVALEAALEREKRTLCCPTCGSDAEPRESSKDGSLCPDDFHAASSADDKAGE
jgi:hypothetical protein